MSTGRAGHHDGPTITTTYGRWGRSPGPSGSKPCRGIDPDTMDAHSELIPDAPFDPSTV